MANNPEKIAKLFERCLQLLPEQQQDLLDRDADGQTTKRTVLELLDADADYRERNIDPIDWTHATKSASDLPKLKSIGPYELVEKIGKGGFGEVFQATTQDGQMVAIKLLNPWLVETQSQIRFQREGELLSRVFHPNVARFIESGVEQDRPYLVTELISGQPLSNPVNKEASLKTKITWFVEACHGIAAAHENLVLHRDIKPSNIVVNSSGRAVVTDFGIAKTLELFASESPLTATGDFLGTPNFMAPEQLEFHPNLATSTDIYGLGATLFWLLTGRPPFEGNSLVELATRVKNEPVRSPLQVVPDLDRELVTICNKCLRKDPNRRYATVNELINDSTRWLEGRPIEARPVSKLEKIYDYLRENSLVASLCVTLAMVLIGSLFLFNSSDWDGSSDRQRRATVEDLHTLSKEAENNQYDAVIRKNILTRLTQAYDDLESRGPLDDETLKKSAVAWLELGRASISINEKGAGHAQIEEAERRFRILAERHPAVVSYQNDIFHCLLSRSDEAAALKQIEYVIRLEPDNLYYREACCEPTRHLAQSLILEGKYKEAERLCDRGIQIMTEVMRDVPPDASDEDIAFFQKNYAMLHLTRSRALILNREFGRAKPDLEKGLEVIQDCRRRDPKIQFFMANELNMLIRLSTWEILDQNYARAAELIESAKFASLEYLFSEKGIQPEAYLTRSLVLRQAMALAIESGNHEQVLIEQRELEQHLDRWQNLVLIPQNFAIQKLEAIISPGLDFAVDSPEFRDAMTLASAENFTSSAESWAKLRAHCYLGEFDKVIESFETNTSIVLEDHQYLHEVALSLSEGKAPDLKNLPWPTFAQQKRSIANSRGHFRPYLCRHHAEAEVRKFIENAGIELD